MSRFSLFVERERGVGAGIDFTDPAGPLAPYYLRTGHVVAAIVLSALFAFVNYAALNHTDIWAHARFGERWLQTGQFFTGDPFCPFAESSIDTVNYSWLSQAVFALVYRAGAALGGGDEFSRLAGGADALRFFHSVLVTLRFFLLFVAFRRASGSNALAAMGVAFLLATAAGSLAIIRPQVVAEVLCAGLLVAVSPRQISRSAIICIPLVMIVWANAHGSYPLGFIILGLMWLSQLLAHLVGPPPRLYLASIDPNLRRLLVSIVLAIVGVTFLNPMGYRIYLVTLEMAQQPNVRAMNEWQPLWTPNITTGARIAYGICVILLIAAVAAAQGRCQPLFWLGVVVFAVPPIFSQRAVVWLIPAALWLALPEFGQAVRRWQPTWWDSTPSFRKTLYTAALALAAMMWSIPVQRLLNNKEVDPGKSLSAGTPWLETLAVENPTLVADTPLAKAIVAAFPNGRFHGTLFTGDVLGDFFLWRLPAPVPVFMYSHVHLFSPARWREYQTIRDTQAGWEELLNRYRINLVVVGAEPRLGICEKLTNHPSWTVVTNELGLRTKLNPHHRLFVALRKKPLEPLSWPPVQ